VGPYPYYLGPHGGRHSTAPSPGLTKRPHGLTNKDLRLVVEDFADALIAESCSSAWVDHALETQGIEGLERKMGNLLRDYTKQLALWMESGVSESPSSGYGLPLSGRLSASIASLKVPSRSGPTSAAPMETAIKLLSICRYEISRRFLTVAVSVSSSSSVYKAPESKWPEFPLLTNGACIAKRGGPKSPVGGEVGYAPPYENLRMDIDIEDFRRVNYSLRSGERFQCLITRIKRLFSCEKNGEKMCRVRHCVQKEIALLTPKCQELLSKVFLHISRTQHAATCKFGIVRISKLIGIRANFWSLSSATRCPI
jgi:hypothetical protein